MGHGWYAGDVVEVRSARAGTTRTLGAVIREVDHASSRARLQIGRDQTWVPTDSLIWRGRSLTRLPRTERGWRRVGRMIGQAESGA